MTEENFNPSIRLKKALDTAQLSTDGVVFDIDENYVDQEAKQALDEQNGGAAGGQASFSKADYSQYFKELDYTNDKESGSDDDQSPFDIMAESMDDISPDHNKGVLKQIIRESISDEVVTMESMVYVHYNAYIDYSDEPFDSTYMRNREAKISMGKQETIEGLTIALLSMHVGETSKFLIKPEFAFGKSGCPPRVPMNATLLYKIELLKIHDSGPIDKYFSMTCSEKLNAGYPLIKKVGEKYMAEAKNHFKMKRYETACKRYNEAIRILDGVRMADEVEEADQQALMLKLNVNAAVSFSRCSNYPRVVTLCKDALHIDSQSLKALFLLGKAYRNVGEFKMSDRFINRALKISPENVEIRSEMDLLQNQKKKSKDINQAIYKKMFDIKTKDETVAIPEIIEDLPSFTNLSLKDCSEEQKNMNSTIRMIFKDFKKDDTITEMPVKVEDYSQQQIDYIRKVADTMDLDTTLQSKTTLKVGKSHK